MAREEYQQAAEDAGENAKSNADGYKIPEQQPMSDAQPSPWPLGVSTEVFVAGLKARIRELTDENNALRAREAELVEVVRAVANGWNNALGMRIGETPMDGVELKRKARALLASESDEAK